MTVTTGTTALVTGARALVTVMSVLGAMTVVSGGGAGTIVVRTTGAGFRVGVGGMLDKGIMFAASEREAWRAMDCWRDSWMVTQARSEQL